MPMTASGFGLYLVKLARIGNIMGELRAANTAARTAARARFGADAAKDVGGAAPSRWTPGRTAPEGTPALPGPSAGQTIMSRLSPYMMGAGIGGGLGFYRGYTHDRKEPFLGGVAQGLIGATGGTVLSGLLRHAFRP